MVTALFGLSALGFGQATDANLVGTVVDASAAAVPNASIELTNTATGIKTTTKTDTSGLYRFNNLPVGPYDLRAAAAGLRHGHHQGPGPAALATAQSIQDSNLNGDTAGDRTVINPAGDPLLGSGVSALKNSAGATVAYLPANPGARYIRAGLGVFPNAGRNTVPMPGIDNFDLSIGKQFNIREGKSVELRADAANAFNHPQFTPGAVNSVKLTTYSTGDRTYLGPQNSNFQAWNQTFASNARAMQLALKVVF